MPNFLYKVAVMNFSKILIIGILWFCIVYANDEQRGIQNCQLTVIGDSGRIELARYKFLLNRLYPRPKKKDEIFKIRKVIQPIAAVVMGATVSAIAMLCIQSLPLADIISLPWLVRKMIEGVLKVVDFKKWIFRGVVIAGMVALYPWMNALCDLYKKESDCNQIRMLNDLIKRWPDYRMCVPERFHAQCELLFLMYHANNKKLPEDVQQMQLIIDTITVQLADVLCKD